MTAPIVLIDYDGLKERGIKLSPRQLQRKIVAGTFPKPVMLGEQTKTWVASEVDGWLAKKVAERDRARAA